MTRKSTLVLVLLIVGMLTACSAGGGDSAGGESAAGGAEDEFSDSSGDRAALSAGDGETGEEAADGDDTDDAGPVGADQPLGALTAVSTGDKVIKDGSITLEVDADGFERAFQAVVTAANRLGGTFVASTSETDDDERPSGSVTVRVPVEEYENLLVGVQRIGTVRSQQITSEDVTTEYVDLRSRLRQQQAQERFYLGLLDRAEGVDDAIAVQQQLQTIQTEIERIQGRLQFIDDRTAWSTLTVELFEPGAPLIAAAPGAPTFGAYWATARDSFVSVAGTLLVTVVALLPLLVPVGIAVAAYRGLRRRPVVPNPGA